MLIYEKSELQEKALNVTPLKVLSEQARKRLDAINNPEDSKPLDFQVFLYNYFDSSKKL